MRDEERFSAADAGADGYKYVVRDYRKPIQRVFDRGTEHSERDYGKDFGGAMQVGVDRGTEALFF